MRKCALGGNCDISRLPGADAQVFIGDGDFDLEGAGDLIG